MFTAAEIVSYVFTFTLKDKKRNNANGKKKTTKTK
jgi:hypothetical protein